MSISPQSAGQLALIEEYSSALRAADEVCRSLGYYPARFEQMLQHDAQANLKLAKAMLTSGKIHDGLKRLAKMGHLELSLERISLEERFRPLFSADDIAAAEWRLQQVGPGRNTDV